MPGRCLVSILLLASALQVTSGIPDVLERSLASLSRASKVKSEETLKNLRLRTTHVASGKVTERDPKLLSHVQEKTKYGITDVETSAAVKSLQTANESSQKNSITNVTIKSRISDKDIDIPQAQTLRIDSDYSDNIEDVDEKSHKNFGYLDPYGPKLNRPRKGQGGNERIVTRPSITFQSSTKSTPKPYSYQQGSITNQNQNGVRKTTTSKPGNVYGSPNYYDNGTPDSYFNGNSRPQNVYSVTTQNPFFASGVKPAVVNNDRAPFTNKPISITERTTPYGTRPADVDAIMFPEDPKGGPTLVYGRDEEDMSYEEKRRYENIAERMCDKYKALETKQLEAIPLLPSPEPVRVNISDCTPLTVPLVVGGKVVTIKEFPHMALLGWPKLQIGGYSWKCGGSLISEQFVLTAAHCANQERDNTVVTGPPRAAQLGSSYLDDPGALVVKISAVIRHPKYKPPRSYYDIAIAKLVSPVKFSERIKPACLGKPPPAGDSIVATGWGRTETSDQSEELRSVSIPIWDMEDCWSTLGTSKKLPNGPTGDNQICAGERRGGKDTCQGDSGGPAQIQDGCVWRIVGVTSVGRGCGAPHTPGLYSIANIAFIASHVFANQNFNGQDRNGHDSTDHSSSRPPKTNRVTHSYDREDIRDFGESSDRFENDYVNDSPQNSYGTNNHRNNNYDRYNSGFGQGGFGGLNTYSKPMWTRF